MGCPLLFPLGVRDAFRRFDAPLRNELDSVGRPWHGIRRRSGSAPLHHRDATLDLQLCSVLESTLRGYSTCMKQLSVIPSTRRLGLFEH